MSPGGLRIPLDAIRRRGAPRTVDLEVVLPDLAVGVVEVSGGRVAVDLAVEARGNEVAVLGRLTADWAGECRRCLGSVSGHVDMQVSEVFVPDVPGEDGRRPDEGDFYLLSGEELDLEPVVRDAVLLVLPLSPLCADDCMGPDPERFPAGPADGDPGQRPMDPRWAVLDALRDDAGGEQGS